jgi:hypothetical protein
VCANDTAKVVSDALTQDVDSPEMLFCIRIHHVLRQRARGRIDSAAVAAAAPGAPNGLTPVQAVSITETLMLVRLLSDVRAFW